MPDRRGFKFDPESVGYFRLMMDLRSTAGIGRLRLAPLVTPARENGLRSGCLPYCSRSIVWYGCSDSRTGLKSLNRRRNEAAIALVESASFSAYLFSRT